MRRFANLAMLLLALVCSTPTGYAQEVSEVVERVKSRVQEKPLCWELNREQERRNGERTDFEQEWLCRKEVVTVYFYQLSTIEAAVNLFENIRNAPVASPGLTVNSHKFGDQSFITSHSPYSRSSYVFFRKGNIVVRIEANTVGDATSAHTLKNAIRFAQIVVD